MKSKKRLYVRPVLISEGAGPAELPSHSGPAIQAASAIPSGKMRRPPSLKPYPYALHRHFHLKDFSKLI